MRMLDRLMPTNAGQPPDCFSDGIDPPQLCSAGEKMKAGYAWHYGYLASGSAA